MLTRLSTVKARLVIDDFNVEFDTLLTNPINAISSRFDKETNRILSRAANETDSIGKQGTEIWVSSARNS